MEESERSDVDAIDELDAETIGELPDDADLTLSERDRRELVEWTLACAERMLPLFLAERPEDARPRAALDAAY
ncbi:MAG: putative immunity protein, partial [Microbacterium sp.]